MLASASQPGARGSRLGGKGESGFPLTHVPPAPPPRSAALRPRPARRRITGTNPLWPAAAPGETAELPPESDVTKPTDGPISGRPIIRLGNVSQPTITVFPAPADKNTGAAVLVCPGGGYGMLAYDLEGTEVCAWLNSIGITGVLLKYRVPARKDRPRHEAPLQDAQRALSLIRHRASEWKLDPQRIGVLGFSAGGHLAATLSTNSAKRSYEPLDPADESNLRPDFAVLIYPAYLVGKEQPENVSAELTINEQTPPTFLVHTQDDPIPVENAVHYYLALKKAKVPAEMHLYPVGGHGYGLRKSATLVTTWPDRAADWLRAAGVLEPKR
jgi:acetyl esterase/lipase